MLRLRLEVQPYAHIHEVCTQATRIATQLGIEVVFEFSSKEMIAKPGMSVAELQECVEYFDSPVLELKGPKLPPKDPKATKETGKKSSKEKEVAPADNVQKEGI